MVVVMDVPIQLPSRIRGYQACEILLDANTSTYFNLLTLKGPSIQIVHDGWLNPILTLKVISFSLNFNQENEA
jgi:hypothetical protein